MEGQEAIQRVEALTAELERLPDPRAQRLADGLVSAVLDMHTAALEGLLAELGPMAALRVAEDERVAAVLLIHGLHPVPLEQRVRAGLDQVRPYMESHGGDVELLGIDQGIAQLRLKGTCNGCRASSSTLELAVQKALEETAPDLLGMEVEGAVEEAPLLQIEQSGNAPRQLEDWASLDGAGDVEPGALVALDVEGRDVLVANVDGELLAYRDACASCGQPLSGGSLDEGVLACPSCERRWYLPRAGRSLDDERAQLDPIPLLAGADHGVRIALPR